MCCVHRPLIADERLPQSVHLRRLPPPLLGLSLLRSLPLSRVHVRVGQVVQSLLHGHCGLLAVGGLSEVVQHLATALAGLVQLCVVQQRLALLHCQAQSLQLSRRGVQQMSPRRELGGELSEAARKRRQEVLDSGLLVHLSHSRRPITGRERCRQSSGGKRATEDGGDGRAEGLTSSGVAEW